MNGAWLKAFLVLAALAGLLNATEILFLNTGNEIEGEVLSVGETTLKILTPDRERIIPLITVAAIKKDGVLSNGPFGKGALLHILNMKDPEAGKPEPIDGVEPPPPGQSMAIRGYLRYGITVFTTSLQPNRLNGAYSSQSSFTKHFTRCTMADGKEACGNSQWIGFTGENLASAVGDVPEAKRLADRVRTTTLVQIASLVATPIFLISTINVANSHKDKDGKVSEKLEPGALVLLCLTGASFLNYAVWNIYEGVLVRKIISVHNQKIGITSGLGRDNAVLGITYGF